MNKTFYLPYNPLSKTPTAPLEGFLGVGIFFQLKTAFFLTTAFICTTFLSLRQACRVRVCSILAILQVCLGDKRAVQNHSVLLWRLCSIQTVLFYSDGSVLFWRWKRRFWVGKKPYPVFRSKVIFLSQTFGQSTYFDQSVESYFWSNSSFELCNDFGCIKPFSRIVQLLTNNHLKVILYQSISWQQLIS